jgi:hypothetical protein
MNGHLVKVGNDLYYLAGYSDAKGDIPGNDLKFDYSSQEWDIVDKPKGDPVLRHTACIVRGP